MDWSKVMGEAFGTKSSNMTLNELEKCKEQRDILERVIDMMDDGVLIADGNGVCIHINPAFTRISGLTKEMLIGNNHRDMEKAGIVEKSCVVRVLDEKREVIQICEYTIMGTKALVTGRPLFDEQNRMLLMVITARDVTALNDLEIQMKKEQKLRQKYERESEFLKEQIIEDSEVIAVDQNMKNVLIMSGKAAKVDATVLITGQTGVGKEEVARYIHRHSDRSKEPFIAVNCGAIPESLVESELFGYEKNSFTGASKNGKIGLIEAADKGILFLDEIGELPLSVQVKLLRFMQSKQITRVGGHKPVDVDVRIITATHRNLKKMVEQEEFREDLYYRINVVPIQIPCLKNRKEDIIPLIKHFLDYYNRKYKVEKNMSEMAYRVFYEYEWPGNVRELKNLVERLVVISDSDTITAAMLPIYKEPEIKTWEINRDIPLKERMEEMEFRFLDEAYNEHGSVRKAAEALQMSCATFARKYSYYKQKKGLR